jgi:hypothetical protein
VTKPRKRNRTKYRVVDWAPRLVSVHKSSALVVDVASDDTDQASGAVVHCRGVVVNSDVLQWVNTLAARSSRLVVSEQATVHGYWLPARVVIEGSGAKFVVDVDLVPHTDSAMLKREQDLLRSRQTSGVQPLRRRASWSRLWVHNGNGSDILLASHHTQRYDLHVTSLQVLPLSQRPGKRGQRAVVGSVHVSVNDLLNVALAQTQLHGNVKPGNIRKRTAGVIQAHMLAPGEVPKQPRGRVRGQRTTPTDELLARVRDVHQAAPHGGKLQAVMHQCGFEKRQAQVMIRKSQLRYNWGVASRRKSTKKHTTRKQGSKS